MSDDLFRLLGIQYKIAAKTTSLLMKAIGAGVRGAASGAQAAGGRARLAGGSRLPMVPEEGPLPVQGLLNRRRYPKIEPVVPPDPSSVVWHRPLFRFQYCWPWEIVDPTELIPDDPAAASPGDEPVVALIAPRSDGAPALFSVSASPDVYDVDAVDLRALERDAAIATGATAASAERMRLAGYPALLVSCSANGARVTRILGGSPRGMVAATIVAPAAHADGYWTLARTMVGTWELL